MIPLRIGTSGWAYSHWKQRFYPSDVPPRQWLEFYAGHFDSVEINASFYHLPPAATFAGWRERTPPGFLFAVKAPRQITHWRRLANCEEALGTFLDRAKLLGEKLGPVLFQCPPRWRADAELLGEFLACLPQGPHYVFEFRDPSWLCEEVYGELRQAGAGLCRSSSPAFPDAAVETAPFVYLRMHGGTSLYNSCYSEEELAIWAKRVRAWREGGLAAYVYFNNDARAYAVENARSLARLLRT